MNFNGVQVIYLCSYLSHHFIIFIILRTLETIVDMYIFGITSMEGQLMSISTEGIQT